MCVKGPLVSLGFLGPCVKRYPGKQVICIHGANTKHGKFPIHSLHDILPYFVNPWTYHNIEVGSRRQFCLRTVRILEKYSK